MEGNKYAASTIVEQQLFRKAGEISEAARIVIVTDTKSLQCTLQLSPKPSSSA